MHSQVYMNCTKIGLINQKPSNTSQSQTRICQMGKIDKIFPARIMIHNQTILQVTEQYIQTSLTSSPF